MLEYHRTKLPVFSPGRAGGSVGQLRMCRGRIYGMVCLPGFS